MKGMRIFAAAGGEVKCWVVIEGGIPGDYGEFFVVNKRGFKD